MRNAHHRSDDAFAYRLGTAQMDEEELERNWIASLPRLTKSSADGECRCVDLEHPLALNRNQFPTSPDLLKPILSSTVLRAGPERRVVRILLPSRL